MIREPKAIRKQLEAKIETQGKYATPYLQFVYSEKELSDAEIAETWNTTSAAVRREREKDAKRGVDWAKARNDYWQTVSSRVSETIEQQALEDVESTAAVYRSIIGYVNTQLQSKALKNRVSRMVKDDVNDGLKALNMMARTAKVCVDIEDRLTGSKAIQELFDAQMVDYNWFAEAVKRHVRDPEVLTRLAFEIQSRRTTRSLVAAEEYAEHIVYARSPARDFDRVMNMVDNLDKRLQKDGIIDVTPVEDSGEKTE
jgi:hypothetical protein